MELRIRIRANPRRAAIGWMRSAYHAAFALYGYHYTLQPAFEPLRATIADPVRIYFEPFLLRSPEPATVPLQA